MRLIVFTMALLATTPAMAADQFDLICNAKKEAEHYRVDLVKNEWCLGKCDNVLKIASATSGMIVFADHNPTFKGDYTAYNRVNRVTGDWEWYNYDPKFIHVQDIKGTCTPAPFSGTTSSSTAKF